MTNKPFMKEEREPLSARSMILVWVAVAVGIIILGVASFFITKNFTAPAPLVAEEPDRLIEDEFSSEMETLLESTVQPGDVIEEGKKGEAAIGKDLETNFPLVGDVELSDVQEVDPMNIGPLKLEKPMLGDYGARIWYVTASVTVDEKPSAGTSIHFPFALSNDNTPADDTKGLVFPRTNPECLYGPETWGQVDGNTATMCRVLITFNEEPIDKILLVFAGMNYEEHPEYASNPPTYDFTAKAIEG